VIAALSGALATAIALSAFGPARLGVLLVVGALAGLSLVNPGAYLFATVAIYSALQGLLAEFPAGDLFPVPVNASQVFMALLTLWWACRILIGLARREGVPKPSAAINAHLAFFAWSAVTVLLAPEKDSVAAAARLAACVTIHFVGYWLGSVRRWEGFVPGAIAFAAIAAGGSAAIEAITARRVAEAISYGAFRAGGSFGGPVVTATVAMVGLPVFCAWILPGNSRRRRVIAALGLVAVAGGIVGTLTRTALVGTALFGVLLVTQRRVAAQHGRVRRAVIAFAPIALVLLLLLAVPDKYVASRSADLPGYQGGGAGLGAESGSGRGLLWRGMLTIQGRSSAAEWLTGHGLESVLRDLPPVTGIRAGGHNSYLEVLYQLGLIGLVILVVMVTANIRLLKPPVGADPATSRICLYWRDYYFAYLLSTIMFNGFIWDVGATWFTDLGLGYAQAKAAGAGSAVATSGVRVPPAHDAGSET